MWFLHLDHTVRHVVFPRPTLYFSCSRHLLARDRLGRHAHSSFLSAGDLALFAVGGSWGRHDIRSGINIAVVTFRVSSRAILGDSVNYKVGPRYRERRPFAVSNKFIIRNTGYRNQGLYDRYGRPVRLLARFAPTCVLRGRSSLGSGNAYPNASSFRTSAVSFPLPLGSGLF